MLAKEEGEGPGTEGEQNQSLLCDRPGRESESEVQRHTIKVCVRVDKKRTSISGYGVNTP